MTIKEIIKLKEKVIDGYKINFDEALELYNSD